ncbi:MAG: proline iminopeptidase-family hydrolase [Acidimicrobiales bacterium]
MTGLGGLNVSVVEGVVEYGELRTWYMVVGALEERSPDRPAPLVTIHGGPGATHDYLLSMVDLSADGRAVIFYDQIGNGRSAHFRERRAEFFTVALFVDELARLVNHLGIEDRYHILGQSWGGMLALEHLLTAPRGLRSAVLSNTAAAYPSFTKAVAGLRAELPTDVEATLRRHEIAGTTNDPEYLAAARVFYDLHVCRLTPRPDPVERSFAAMDEDPTVYFTTNGPTEFHTIGSFTSWSVLDRLDEIRAPVLVVSGGHDEATPEIQQEIVTGIAGSEQLIFENSSHMPFWEQRAEYMAAVGDFLRRHD